MNRLTLFLFSLLLSLVTGCATQPNEHEMNYLGSALTKLSASVDATARYKRAADGLSGDQLLQASTDHDPELLKPFNGYTVRVMRSGRDSAVLICQAGGGNALLEDAGCTTKMDVHRWRQDSQRCEFTLDVQTTCAR